MRLAWQGQARQGLWSMLNHGLRSVSSRHGERDVACLGAWRETSRCAQRERSLVFLTGVQSGVPKGELGSCGLT